MEDQILLQKLLSRLVTLILVCSVLLSACQGQAAASPTPDNSGEEEARTTLVSATGVVVPARYSKLSMSASGVIAEVLVSEGDFVQEGQVLLRLSGGDPQNPSPNLEAAILVRELEVDAAQQALDGLDDQAEALSLQAQQTFNAAISQIRDLQYSLAMLELPESQRNLTPLQAYDAALAVYQEAEAAFAPYRDADDNSERRERKDDLDQAKHDYDIAVTRLQLYLSLEAAQANRDQARVDWEKYRNGPPENEKLQAKKRLNSAIANLDAAQSALDSLTLVAPFSGTVSTVYVRAGEWLAPGIPVLVIADLSSFQIETTDLNEIDVVRIALGDTVQISFDALPEVMLSGRVAYIAGQASPGAGVNYRVIITLENAPASLRWGMSAFVDIIPKK